MHLSLSLPAELSGSEQGLCAQPELGVLVPTLTRGSCSASLYLDGFVSKGGGWW